jgi:hypothetical protein
MASAGNNPIPLPGERRLPLPHEFHKDAPALSVKFFQQHPTAGY